MHFPLCLGYFQLCSLNVFPDTHFMSFQQWWDWIRNKTNRCCLREFIGELKLSKVCEKTSVSKKAAKDNQTENDEHVYSDCLGPKSWCQLRVSSPLTPSSEKLVPLRAEGALCFREVLMNVFSLVLYFSSQKVAALWNGSSFAERSKNWPSHKHILPSLPPACPFHGLCALSRSQSK